MNAYREGDPVPWGLSRLISEWWLTFVWNTRAGMLIVDLPRRIALPKVQWVSCKVLDAMCEQAAQEYKKK